MAESGQHIDFLAEVRKLRKVLQGVDFFNRFKIEDLELMVEHLKKRTVPRGHIIITQGDPKADAFYMIASGKCTVWKKKGRQMGAHGHTDITPQGVSRVMSRLPH